MKIVVTGNTGYIGSVMTEQLVNVGYDVIGIDAKYFPRNLKCVSVGLQSGVSQIIKDIRDVQEEDLKGAEAVVHLAALSNDPMGELNPERTSQINYVATIRLAQIAKKVGARRFIFSSSCSVYGARQGEILQENSEPIPVTAYAKSKVDAERDLIPLADRSFAPVILRNATAYGLSPSMRLDLVVNNLVACAYATGSIVLLSDGMAWRPQVHIRDIGLAVQKCLETPIDRISSQVFNVGENSENYTVREIAAIVKEASPGSAIEFDPKGGKDSRSYRVDFSKIRDWLKFRPAWNVRKGVHELRQALKGEAFSSEEFRNTRFYRVPYLTGLVEKGLLDRDLRWRTRKS